MKKINSYLQVLISAMLIVGIITSCSGNKKEDKNIDTETVVVPDTAVPIPMDTIPQTPPEEDPHKIINYEGSVLPKIEAASKEYAEKLREKGQDGFIVVDKARMKVILYDKNGMPEKTYGMACAKNYGTKHKKADSRTPEGFFYVQGVYDSTDWLFTDDNGVTSKKKGQFGPRFIRLSIPTTTQIGIHGTCAPWSIGHRVSHGCIRLTNESIMELVDLVHPGMPVIVIPGKRDRQVNREEGVNIVYFPTSPETSIKASELKEMSKSKETPEEDSISSMKSDTLKLENPKTIPEESIDNGDAGKINPEVPDSI